MSAIWPALRSAIFTAVDGDEVAARDLLRRWERTLREAEERAERIRRQVREAGCSCSLARPADRLTDGRCSRCYGRAREAAG